jgi:lambda repressor-like predicted transcriptional regulator
LVEGSLLKKELAEYISRVCKEKGLSLRSLSVNAGLSPGTVHSLINRGYEPSLYTLNRLADYLGVKRQYLWKLAGLLEDEDYDSEMRCGYPQMAYYCDKLNNLPEPAREMVIHIVSDIVNYHTDLMRTKS